MQRTLRVGKGLLKKDIDTAVEVAQPGDTLVFDPGEYVIPILPGGVKLRGASGNPNDVKIRTQSLLKNRNVSLSDLTIKQLDEKIFSLILFNCEVRINNCNIDSCLCRGNKANVLIKDTNIYTSIGFKEGVNFDLKNIKIYNSRKLNALSIRDSTGNITDVKIEGKLNFTAVFIENSKVNINNLTVNRNMFIINNSNVTIEKYETSYQGIDTIMSDSILQIGEVFSDNAQFRVSGYGKLSVKNALSMIKVFSVKYNKAEFSLPPNTEKIENVEPKKSDRVRKSALDKLNDLIGLNSVKEEVKSFIKTTRYNEKRQKQGKKTIELGLHSLFLGNPGTGKTTVARLLGEVMYEEGILPRKTFVEVDAGDLVAQHVGQTAPKTKNMLNKALGGVFFLDEAYSLTSRGTFGQEALDTILKFMEDNRGNIMVIFAGYDNEMQDLLNMNSGLSSRFPNKFHFEDYSTEEITKLGLISIDRDFKLDKEAYINGIKKAYNPKLCSNGRWIREINGKLERMAISNTDNDDNPVIDQSVIDKVLGLQKQNTSGNTLDELNKIIGLKKVKEEVQKFVEMSRMNQQRIENGFGASELQLHSLFLGNPGTGKTTVARLLGKIMFEEGILPKDSFVEVDAGDLVGEHVGQTAPKTKKMLNKALGGVFFLDEAYSLTSRSQYGQEALDTILKFMEDNRDDIMVIFAGYDKEMQDLLEMNSGLESRFPNEFHFENYTAEEITEIGLKMLNSKGGIEVDEAAYSSAIKEGYNPELCDNARWIRNKNGNLIKEAQHRQLADSSAKNDGTIKIISEDINKVFEITRKNEVESSSSALDAINELVGLDSVKKQINSFINIAKVNKIRQERGLPLSNRTLHSLFLGNPGTGKTTVAELLGKALYQEGVIQRNQCINVKREDLVAQYVGQTAIKTKKVLERSLGGVLFVDEAYTLASGGKNDFGKEALDTILAFMEDHRNDIVVIFAGYNREMEQVLEMNSGLKSRFPNVFQFEDYTPEEISIIGTKMLEKQKYTFNHELYATVIKEAYIKVKDKPEYKNARGVRNLNQKLVDIQENNLFTQSNVNVEENITVISDKDLLEFNQLEL